MKLFRKHKPVLIFSVYNHDDPVIDRDEHRDLAEMLPDERYKVVEGRYNGDWEQAFLVSAAYWEDVLTLAYNHDQTHVLYLDEYRQAYLIRVDRWHDEEPDTPPEQIVTGFWLTHVTQYPMKVDLGAFRPTSTIDRDQDYTWDPTTDTFYTTEIQP